jgi:hypothetical protein
MEERKHHSMRDLAAPCAFLTKPTHPPRSSNTQGAAKPHLNFLSILDQERHLADFSLT